MTPARRILRPLPVDHENFADLLHRKGIQCLADLRDVTAARLTVVAENTDLDQFVAAKMHIDLADHGGCQTGVTDDHDGIEMMGACFQKSTPLRGQCIHGASLTVCAAFSAGKGGIFSGA